MIGFGLVIYSAGVWEMLFAMVSFCLKERRELHKVLIRGLIVPHWIAPLFPELHFHV